MGIEDTSTPVVVLGSAHHCGLGITRSLGRLGIPVFNVDSTRSAPAFYSRYCRGRFIWDLSRESSGTSITRLNAISRRAGRPCVLIPTTDREALFVEDNADSLREHFIFAASGPSLVRSLSSKRIMQELAGANGVPTARTACPTSHSELLEASARMDYPMIVKTPHRLKEQGGKTKVIVRNSSELTRLASQVPEADIHHLIVQEYIPAGVDWMFNGYFNRHSECLVGATGRKLRQCPANTGVTSFGQCGPNPTVETMAVKFLQALGYTGIVDMDFRFDHRDGTYKLLDVNPRIGGTFRLFTSPRKMDMARALYLDLTGQPVIADEFADGRTWIVEDFDLLAAWTCYRQKKLTFREWIRSVFGAHERAFLAVDDMFPVLAAIAADIMELLQRGPLAPVARREEPVPLRPGKI